MPAMACANRAYGPYVESARENKLLLEIGFETCQRETCSLLSESDARVIYANEILLPAGTAGLRVDSIALCYQIRALDKGRLSRDLGELDDVNLQQERYEAIRFQLDM